MNRARIQELRAELDAERISYGELAEIESAFEGLGIVPDEGMMASDMLDELEEWNNES